MNMSRVSRKDWTGSAVLVALLFAMSLSAAAQEAPVYREAKAPVEQRVADLLARMTLEEKVAQLVGTWQNKSFIGATNPRIVDQKDAFDAAQAGVLLKYGLGGMSRPSENRGPREMAEFTNSIQKWLKENTRLGSPILFHEECLHGNAAPKATSFPQAIALASTWDPALVQEVFTSVAAEVRAKGAQECLASVMDLDRDPRWGRTEETYGEDPYLVSRLGVAAIHGYQGAGPYLDKSHVFATAKHFAVHGQPEAGTNAAPGNYSERVIREYFLKPFEAAVREAHVATVMPSYNEIDGIPSHSNVKLLTGILRQEWGFDGVVVSDYFGIDELRKLHHVVSNKEDAARMALDAGVDMELPFPDAYTSLIAQVKAGRIAEARVYQSVGPVLRMKFLAGMFCDSFNHPGVAGKITHNPEHPQLALRAGPETINLLKKQNNPFAHGKSREQC